MTEFRPERYSVTWVRIALVLLVPAVIGLVYICWLKAHRIKVVPANVVAADEAGYPAGWPLRALTIPKDAQFAIIPDGDGEGYQRWKTDDYGFWILGFYDKSSWEEVSGHVLDCLHGHRGTIMANWPRHSLTITMPVDKLEIVLKAVPGYHGLYVLSIQTDSSRYVRRIACVVSYARIY